VSSPSVEFDPGPSTGRAEPREIPGLLGRRGPIAPFVTAIAFLIAPHATGQPAVAQGVWLMNSRVAVQIYDCAGLMCGRIVWLRVPRDPQGRLDRDKNNPNLALRQRKLCGLTILWGLRANGPDRWQGGWFYNPNDGKTYRVTAQLESPDVLVARIYSGLPIFGVTRTLTRIPRGASDGWC
jgi:uncharacterized protein (DUF2147 family)